MDERNKQIAYRVMSVMYLLTILAMQGIVIYRQFALRQDLHDFEDLAVLMTINSLFLVSALLYFGAVTVRKLSIPRILLIYIVFIILGGAFVYIKYSLMQSPGLSVNQMVEKMMIIATITGLILGFWILLSFLGKRRLEKEIE
ncbi:MAG: hypothetical protein P8100_08395 [bacterium]|jgi:magnesium-transporting ATPase (P-type)